MNVEKAVKSGLTFEQALELVDWLITNDHVEGHGINLWRRKAATHGGYFVVDTSLGAPSEQLATFIGFYNKHLTRNMWILPHMDCYGQGLRMNENVVRKFSTYEEHPRQ